MAQDSSSASASDEEISSSVLDDVFVSSKHDTKIWQVPTKNKVMFFFLKLFSQHRA